MYTLSYRVLAAKRARKGSLLGGANEDAEKFGSLKAVLESIPAVFANRQVCLFFYSEFSPDGHIIRGLSLQ